MIDLYLINSDTVNNIHSTTLQLADMKGMDIRNFSNMKTANNCKMHPATIYAVFTHFVQMTQLRLSEI